MNNAWIAYMASEMKWQPPPAPWQSHTEIIAALSEVGYAQDNDLVLVISETGRGVFNCLTGERVARDRDSKYSVWRDEIHLTAKGIGPIENQTIQLAGDHGGGLKTVAAGGWRLELISPYWPLSSVVLCSSYGSVFHHLRPLENCIKIFPNGDGDEILTYGFSDTEKSFIVATRNTLAMFYRP